MGLLGVTGLGGAQSRLDGVDTLVAEAGDFDIGTDLGWLGGQALANVRLELIGGRLARESNTIPDFGVAIDCVSMSPTFAHSTSARRQEYVRDGQLEGIDSMAVLAV